MIKTRGTRELGTGAGDQASWISHASSEYSDWSKTQADALTNHRSAEMTIALRLPETLLDRIKIEADKRDMPYQLLIKVWLAEALEQSRNQY